MQGKQRFMGDEAAAIQKSNYKNTPLNIKRLLGRKFAEPEVSHNLKAVCGAQFPFSSHTRESVSTISVRS